MPVHHSRAKHHRAGDRRHLRRLSGTGEGGVHGRGAQPPHEAHLCQLHQRCPFPPAVVLLFQRLCAARPHGKGGQPCRVRPERELREHHCRTFCPQDGAAGETFHCSQQPQRRVPRIPQHRSIHAAPLRGNHCQRHGRGQSEQFRTYPRSL